MNQLRSLTLVLVLSVGAGSTMSCSVWDMVKPSSGLSVDTELVVGDKQQAVNTDIGGTTNTAETIEITNVDENPSFLWSLLFLLGWLAPAPPIPWAKIGGGFLKILPWSK